MSAAAGSKVERFIDAVRALCREHGLSLGHEDHHGAFLVEDYNDTWDRWLQSAARRVDSPMVCAPELWPAAKRPVFVEGVTAKIWNEDNIPAMFAHLEAESIDLTVTSIPFGALFMYSGKAEDIGNNPDGVDMRASQFGLHMRFFIHQLLRVMKPGRNVCIHIQQLLRYKNQHGYMGRRDFRGAVVDLFEAGGFEWIGEVSIPKNPQIIAKRLNLHCLMFETGRVNSTKLAPAVNDYVMFFQKPGEAEVRVKCLYDAVKNPGGWVSQEEWIKWARGVWDDIRETDVLDGWKSARATDEEKHVCPLQLEVIRRCVRLYTNAGELVLDPFMGIGSTACVAIEQGRSAVGFELKESYHSQAERNVEKWMKGPDTDQSEMFTEGEESAESAESIEVELEPTT